MAGSVRKGCPELSPGPKAWTANFRTPRSDLPGNGQFRTGPRHRRAAYGSAGGARGIGRGVGLLEPNFANGLHSFSVRMCAAATHPRHSVGGRENAETPPRPRA